MSDKKSEIIRSDQTPPAQLSAWERWQLPNMDGDVPSVGNALNLRQKNAPRVTAPAPMSSVPEIKPPTADEVEAIRRAAYEEGVQEGRAAGQAEGFQAGYKGGDAEVRAAITRLGQITRVLLEPIPAQDDALEEAVLEMVEKICRRIVYRELLLDSSGILRVVREALDCLQPGAQRIRIHVNAKDADAVLKGLREVGELEEGWRILPHPTITPGGCIVETDTSMVDARAEKRLTSVVQQVYEQQQQALAQKTSQQGHVDQLLDEVTSFAGTSELSAPDAGEPADDSA